MKAKLPWLALAGVGGFLLLQRLGTRRGATDEEVYASLPGDEIVSHPMIETTHAITIRAVPHDVWKWIVQSGYRPSGRAGWYGDTWFNDLIEKGFFQFTVSKEERHEQPGARSADQILPQFQHSEVGDIIPDGPPGSAYFVVKEVMPEQAWVLYSDTHLKFLTPSSLRGTNLASYGEFTWVFVLKPVGSQATRLILRTRARLGPRYVRWLYPPLFYLVESFLPMQILGGIKQRAERMAQAAKQEGIND